MSSRFFCGSGSGLMWDLERKKRKCTIGLQQIVLADLPLALLCCTLRKLFCCTVRQQEALFPYRLNDNTCTGISQRPLLTSESIWYAKREPVFHTFHPHSCKRGSDISCTLDSPYCYTVVKGSPRILACFQAVSYTFQPQGRPKTIPKGIRDATSIFNLLGWIPCRNVFPLFLDMVLRTLVSCFAGRFSPSGRAVTPALRTQ